MENDDISLQKYTKRNDKSIFHLLCGSCQSSNECVGQWFNRIYDTFTITISLTDLLTDILVMIQYYNANKMTFFILSAVILSIAQSSYCFFFAVSYVRHCTGVERLCKIFIVFLCCLPFSPIMSFVFYFTSDEGSKLAEFLEEYCCIHIRFRHRSVRMDGTKIAKTYWFYIGSRI